VVICYSVSTVNSVTDATANDDRGEHDSREAIANDERASLESCSIVKLRDNYHYALASLSRIDEIISLFCKRALYKRLYSVREICNFIDPTNRSYPISTKMSL